VPPCAAGGIAMTMPDEKKVVKKFHNIILEDRRALTVSGVSDVDSFDEQAVMLFTELGELTIRGVDLHMNKLNVETGEVSIEGNISSLSYQDDTPRSSGGFMGKLFR
jgi:sporulation protein YabP